MRIASIAAVFILGLAGLARADVAPEPPADPIPEACKPFIGIWHRTEPEREHWRETWELLVIDSQRVTKLYFMNQKDVNIETQTALFHISCTPVDGGLIQLDLPTATDEEGHITMVVKLDGDTFTTTAESFYDQPGPPPADWKPQTYAVTWKRIGK